MGSNIPTRNTVVGGRSMKNDSFLPRPASSGVGGEGRGGGVSSLSSTSSSTSTPVSVPDPIEMEEVLSEKVLAWVKERNDATVTNIGNPKETKEYQRILSILDSKDKIPSIAKIGNGQCYNFWQDEEHIQGIWRKTTLESYGANKEGEGPEWTTVLDLDKLDPPTVDTASTWVWHGSTLLDEGKGANGKWDRALISLSPGGSDADTTREMDLEKEQFITTAEGGFELLIPAKSSVSYRTRDEVIIGTDFEGDGSTMTNSGYARVIKSWKRGTPLSDAVTIFEAEQTDIAAAQYAYHDRDHIHEFRMRQITFYTSKYEYRSLDYVGLNSGTTSDEVEIPFMPVPIPEDAGISTFGNDAMITLRSDWCPPGSDITYDAGVLLALPMAEVMADKWLDIKVLFQPTETKSLQSNTYTKDYVILSVLEDVRTKLVLWERGIDGVWSLVGGDVCVDEDAVPVGESIDISNVNRDDSYDNSVFIWRNGYLRPDTVELVDDVSSSLKGKPLKANPSMFNPVGLIVEQNFCESKDGTMVPYFVMRKGDMAFDGTNPTLVDAYGGFEISMLPGYSASVGAAWLEAGGVKVIANIRGGGEYGPKWHQAALREKRFKCYEDVEAVAQDLIKRGVTSPSKMACIGGSNGGLMVGNLITRPLSSKLFGAAVCQVPLLDMKIYSRLLAGASWMAEYGNPDEPSDWKFLRNHSPYHILRQDNLGLPEDDKEEAESNPAKNSDWSCPKVLFTTSTRDDRVHPGHARKMVRSLLEEAKPVGKADEVHYWENIEGGHGGAADNKQRAEMWALTYSFLKQTLGL